MILFGLAVQFM